MLLIFNAFPDKQVDYHFNSGYLFKLVENNLLGSIFNPMTFKLYNDDIEFKDLAECNDTF